jgi:histidine triad (HIT) family protein
MADCIFCKIASHEIPGYIVWENERFVAMLDIKPVNPGHLLIIPKDHVEVVFSMDDARYAEAFAIAKSLSAPLQRATDAVRIGLAVEGFGVDHAHIHLIPLHGPHELNPDRAANASPEDLAAMAEKIRQERSRSLE